MEDLPRGPARLILLALLLAVALVNGVYLEQFPYPPHSSHDGYLLIPQLQKLFLGHVPLDPAFGIFRPTLFGGEPGVLDLGARLGRLFHNGVVQSWIEIPHPFALAAAAGLLFPGSLLAPALAFTGYLLALLGALYGIGARIHSRRAGLLAVVLGAGMPGLFGYSRYLEVHLPVAALVTVLVWLLVASDGLKRWLPVAALIPVAWTALRSGESTADSWAVLLCLAGPVLWVGSQRLREGGAAWRKALTLAVLLAGAGLALLLLRDGWRHITDAFLDPVVQYDVVERLGPRWGPVAWFLAYPVYIGSDYVRPPLLGLVLVGLGLAFWRRAPGRWMVLAWWAVPLLALTWMPRKASWYGVVLVPPLALLGALGLASVQGPILRRGLAALSCVVAASQLLAFSFLPASSFPSSLSRIRQPLPVGEWRMRQVDLLRPVDEAEIHATVGDARALLEWMDPHLPATGRLRYVAMVTLAYKHDFALRYLLETTRRDLVVVNLGDTRLRASGYRGLDPGAFDLFVWAPGPFRAWPPGEEERRWLGLNLLCRPGDPFDPFLASVLATMGEEPVAPDLPVFYRPAGSGDGRLDPGDPFCGP